LDQNPEIPSHKAVLGGNFLSYNRTSEAVLKSSFLPHPGGIKIAELLWELSSVDLALIDLL
jgi:hypothetical protein